jgi:ribosomal protein S18 acetylase RimI-like enzyme/mannose-6-phosphate isomerase-like protein (cupin superfamily)
VSGATAWHLRDAAPADAAALAGFAERCFRDTFALDNRPEDMDAYCDTAFGEAKQLAEIEDTTLVTVLAVDPAGRLAGYLQLGAESAQEGIDASSPWELRRLYVDPALKGAGLGAVLMEEALARSRARDADVLWLGVWERNQRAIRFYEKHGFRAVGEHVFHVGSDPQRDLLMARALRADKINLAEKLSRFAEHWSPKVIADLNGQQVKLVKFAGEFVWHHHQQEDELFLVVRGRFRMEFRDRHIWLEEGEMIVVPRGVEHRPCADQEVEVLLFEPASTLNTGNAEDARTVLELDRL